MCAPKKIKEQKKSGPSFTYLHDVKCCQVGNYVAPWNGREMGKVAIPSMVVIFETTAAGVLISMNLSNWRDALKQQCELLAIK